VRVIAFGDSLTAGWDTDGWNVYHRLVADGLQYQYPGTRVELTVHGHPGETTADALRRLPDEVLGAAPDLLLTQFGGNDRGTGRTVDAFRRDLGRLLARARDETSALVIACLPPMVDSNPQNAWNAGAREVAASEGLPAADLDRALRAGDGDSRGPFPRGSHPGNFTHASFAREVARALGDALNLRPALQWRLRTGTRLSAETTYPLAVEVTNLTGAPVAAALCLQHGSRTDDRSVPFAPRQSQSVRYDVPLPVQPFTGRSYSIPLHLLVREAAPAAADARWLTVAPAIRADAVGGGALDMANPTWHTFAPDAFVMGRHQWLGPDDLSARFAVAIGRDRVRFTVEVTDDSIAPANPEDPSQGDSVELYLDLRPDSDQGKPVYGPEVLTIQVVPPAVAGQGCQWRSMEPLPDSFGGLGVTCELMGGGYVVRAELPLEVLKALRGQAWDGFGLDVGVNDADHGGTRKSQMMWAGTADNYLNPGYLAGVYTQGMPVGATRQTLR
jgi:hypothetical protein